MNFAAVCIVALLAFWIIWANTDVDDTWPWDDES